MRTHLPAACIIGMVVLCTTSAVDANTLLDGGRTSSGATPEALISGDIESGGYGAPVVKVSTFNGETGVYVGGQGAWIINNRFALGGGGYGLATSHDVPEEALETYTLDGVPRDLELGLGYGGVLIEYFHNPGRLTHLTFDMLIGAGGIVYTEPYDDRDYDDNRWDASDSFFAFEPGIKAEINVTDWFRINAGVSYLLVSGIDMIGIEDSDVGGVTGNLAFRFGSF